jgi:NADPH-dependent glutamate synthase beta subunit-like oxidoreductase/NAD(P)H-flavin reductase
MPAPIALKLNLGFTYASLFEQESLEKLDRLYLERLQKQDSALHERLLAYRRGDHGFTPVEISTLLIDCAPALEQLVGELFGIEKALHDLRDATLAHDPVFEFKKYFVQRRARRRLLRKEALESFADLDAWLAAKLDKRLAPLDRELAIARFAVALLVDEKAHADDIEKLTRWCIQAMTTSEGKDAVDGWVSFKLPAPTDYGNLVPLVRVERDKFERLQGPAAIQRQRDGFGLTDARMNARQVKDEIHYCILCHDHDGDFCSKGFPEKKGDPSLGLKVNPLGVILTGCPLDEKISEMHALKKTGQGIAALAMIMVDNPMCPATGHRICNDCMKGCIYQKQEPVNIPQIETRCLTDVLALPWGVEIYDLLTRWNPLRARQWLPKPYNGLKVLVCGMGPAGFTLAHHLLMEGFAVVGVDGLKIEPLPRRLIDEPVEHYADLLEALDQRVMAGFGGVAEYGITVRWDKNFLKLIYLSLSRRRHFQVFGGVRFGGTMTVEEAWHLGFDHVVIAVGAGLPQALPIPGSLAIGMRQANDFLMALQLTGAAKKNSLANLQVRLPAVVIGGGLTGVDTATEVQAYYIVQVEKTLARYEALATVRGEKTVRAGLDAASLEILDEFLEHGRAVRAERERAAADGREPDLTALIHRWGGVTIAYRRTLRESPAYTRNHEELTKAFEEGILYAEGLDPKEAKLDRHGHVDGLLFRRQTRNDDGTWSAQGEIVLPARAVLVATGARPNVAYEFEHKGHFQKQNGHYQTHHEANGNIEAVPVALHLKTPDFGAFTSYNVDHKRVSFIGDTHPVFHGSVVGAVASGMRTYPKIVEALQARLGRRGEPSEYAAFRKKTASLLDTRVESIKRLTPSVVELVVRAPLAAKRFQPGQFFRLQNFETAAPTVAGNVLHTEAIALTGSHVDREHGTVSLIVHESGASSRMVATLKPGDPVSLMGPTGVRTRMDGDNTVMIVTEGFGAAHLRAVGPALRHKKCRVLHVALYDRAEDVYLQNELEAAADATLWITREGKPIAPRRQQDRAATGEATDIVRRYAAGELGAPAIPLQDIKRLILQASSCVVRAFRRARENELAPFFPTRPETSASINTPIQCGLKGVCSQCLQWQVDPVTGERTKAVFGCSWQDEPVDIVDIDNLEDRLGQNRLQEHLTNLWLDHLLADKKLPRA